MLEEKFDHTAIVTVVINISITAEVLVVTCHFSNRPHLYPLSYYTPVAVIVVRLQYVKAVNVLLNQGIQLSLPKHMVVSGTRRVLSLMCKEPAAHRRRRLGMLITRGVDKLFLRRFNEVGVFKSRAIKAPPLVDDSPVVCFGRMS